MTDSSLIPETQLQFSPALAATIGVEEAILLQHLGTVFTHRTPETRNGYAWLTIERRWLLDTLPFWTAVDLHRVSKSLADKGVILVGSPPLHESEIFLFAINELQEKAPAKPRPAEPPPNAQRASAGLIATSWSPSEDLLQMLALNHNISRQFALDQLEDFVFYWRERGEVSHAWENKYRQHVLSRWRHQQQHEAERFAPDQNSKLDNSWRPSADALEILQRSEVSQAFMEDAIPEFILYWRERNATVKELNSKFIHHIRRQWARYTSAVSHDTEPRRIPEDWQPTADVYDILHMSHIDGEFAEQLLPEFILYWRDSNQLHQSWNTKFLQHVKYRWANRHQLTQSADANHAAGQQQANTKGRTRDRSLNDDLNDRSWATP
ncbi:hypothetical protein EYC98_18045 [Halieaceae bacterium IMCC14734]|uniref:DnaT DNA-binding domain-containing protein n=1 Tax=Candidatus Litorirhabdus singularis TaxID=2518993 RepID=A0ABT3TKD0_9GAMM|nr:DnaT-like ssDNA-binding domain-containing protein [Candidatus Litorirhabdus singularis]MCX2982768.1 hypothetical protein [Candidatus Litorirhabdus singularis]